MKQIGTWVFGSFFRTIGRLLVFVLLGIIISNLIDFGSLIDNFSITNLFFTKVAAKENYTGWTNWYMSNGSSPTYYGSYITQTYTGNNNSQGVFNFYFKSDKTGISTNNADYFEVNMIYNMYVAQNELSFTDGDQYTCTVNSQYHELGPVDPYETDFEYEVKSFTCPSVSSQTDTYIQNPLFMYQARIYYTDNNWSACKVQECSQNVCTLHCDINKNYANSVNEIRWLYGTSNWNTSIPGNYKITLGMSGAYFLTISDSSQINNSINNQTQQQQQQHEEMMDSNTTQAEDDATDFFENFSSPDIGGLSGIITAPLNTIRSLLNSTCTPLVLPLPFVNENLTLPCMTSIYTTHFGAFFTIYQTIILALVAYRCIRSIYFDIHGFTNPNDDRIEVMDL